MEARSRPSSAPVLPYTFNLKRTHSATRHFNSPSSSSDFNIAVHSTLSPTRATRTSSYSSTSATTSSSINFSVETSASQVRSPRRTPKGGAAMKSIPCALPKKTCMCSVTSHPAEYKKICHDEFAGKDRRCGRRMGEKSPHTPIQPSNAKENVFRGPTKMFPEALDRHRF